MTEGKFKRGDEVRVIRVAKAIDGNPPLRIGETLVVDDHVSSEDSGDGDGLPFYWLNRHGGRGNAWAFEDDLVLSRTREELDARQLPTSEEFADDLGTVISHFYQYDIDESDVDGKRVTFYGATWEGLRFGVMVDVVGVFETDY